MRGTAPKRKWHAFVVGLAMVALTTVFMSAHADEQALNRITAISVEEGPQNTEIIISGSKKPTFSADKLETTPARLLINISNAEFGNIPPSVEVENGVVSMITMQQQSDDLVRIGRVIIGLDRNVPFNVEVRGTQLVVIVDGSERVQRVADGSGPSGQALQDAIARAEAAERRAKAAEEQARSTQQNADARIAAAEANARAAEVQALKAADEARQRADASDRRAKAAQDKATQLAADAENARQMAQAASAQSTNIREASLRRARDAEERAQAAEALAQAARTEATAAANAAQAQVAAATAKTAEAEAQVRAAQARETALRTDADNEAKKAETLAEAANQAQQDANRAEQNANRAKQDAATASQQLETARRELQAMQRRADAAERRAQSAESRAVQAEERAQTAEGRAQQAEAKAAQAQRLAQEAATQSQRKARQAEQRAVAAEQRSKQLESAAESANRKAQRLSAEVARSAATDQARTNLEAELARAREDAAAADERSKAARREATAAKSAANAQLSAAKSRADVAEARSRAAEARANAAETKTREAEQIAEAQARKADELSKAADAAEQRAILAQADLQRANTQLGATEQRNTRLEQKMVAAQRQVEQAKANVRNAQDEAQRAAAQTELAQSKLLAAQARARASEERAAAAANRASDAEQAAATARGNAQRIRANVTSQADEQQALLAEADARTAAAEAKVQRLEADRARLTQENRELQAQKVGTEAAMIKLAAEKKSLDAELIAARKANDESAQQLVLAKQRAQSAEVEVEQARALQISSAQAVSSLREQVKALEQGVAEAEKQQQTEEVTALNRKLAEARQRIGSLESAVDSNQQALAQAKVRAEERKADIAKLEASLRASQGRAEANKASVAVAPTAPPAAVVAPAPAPMPAATPSAPVRTEPAPAPVASVTGEADSRASAASAAPRATTPTPILPPPPPMMRTRVTDVQFAETRDHSTITVLFEGPPARYTVKKEGNRTLILELERSLIDPAIERSLDTTEFRGAVQLVSSFQAPPPGDRVRVVVTLNRDIKGQLLPGNQLLTWRFRIPATTGYVSGGLPPAPRWSGQSATELPTEAAKAAVYTGMGQSIATRRESKKRPVRRKRYTGRKINIDIKDGDIHNILRLLAKEGNVNIVTSDDVKGAVTMHLKLVPWDQALEIILRTKGLDMVREGDIIRVAPSEMIAKEREAELKKQEVKEKLKPLEVKLITVNHADASQLMPRIKSVLSKRGSSQFDTRTNTVILKDVDDHLDAAEDIIRRLDTQTPQVLIETRIVEVNEVNVNQLGIQWGMDSTFSAATGNPTGLRFPSTVGISGGADDQQQSNEGVSSNPNFVVNLPAASGLGSGGALGMTFGSIDSTFNLNIRLSALENRGSVKIVSSPKITTLDNKQATISQGVSIPISQVSAAGIQTVFFDAVLSLEATPHVTQDGNIYLKLRAENNTPDFQNVGARGDPTILKKEAVTELLLKDGDTTVIGGIYTSNAGFNRSEVPYLARIPILGAFFRNHQESDRRSELLIFVTPRIVNRAASTVRTSP